MDTPSVVLGRRASGPTSLVEALLPIIERTEGKPAVASAPLRPQPRSQRTPLPRPATF